MGNPQLMNRGWQGRLDATGMTGRQNQSHRVGIICEEKCCSFRGASFSIGCAPISFLTGFWGVWSIGCLFCLPRNDDGNEFRDYLLEVPLEASWVPDKSTWVVDEAEKPLASWMLSVLRNVDAQLLAKLLVT